MIKWFYYWDEWRRAYWSLIDQRPELFAFLHRLYMVQYMRESGLQRKDEPPVSGGATRISPKALHGFQNRLTSRKKPGGPVGAVSELKASEYLGQADVLFYSHSNRDTCLGVGEKLFDMISEKKLKVTGGFYQKEGQNILNGSEHRGVPVITLRVRPTIRGVIRFACLIPVIYWHGFKSREVAKFIFRHPVISLVCLLKITVMAVCVEQLLDHVKPRVILSCNEQGGGDSSLLFSLAKKRGICTIQYMHAIPARQFVPFICDEYWSWSELTTRMLLGEATDPRVINIGSLEHENQEIARTACGPVLPGERRVLFLAQMGMDEGWGIHAVSAGMRIFCEGICQYKGALAVRVREHPGARGKERAMLERYMTGVPFELTTKDTPLADDVKWATHVYSVSSNAIFAALLGGRPSYLFWNNELDEIHGRGFLPDENIVRSPAEFIETLNRSVSAGNSAATLRQVLGPPGALDRAVERLKQLVAAC